MASRIVRRKIEFGTALRISNMLQIIISNDNGSEQFDCRGCKLVFLHLQHPPPDNANIS